MSEPLRQLDVFRRAGERRVAVATLVSTRGTTPKREGARMWVGEGGRVLGSVTIGGCVDARVVAEAEGVLAAGRPALVALALGDEDARALGLACGGTIDVLVEPLDLTRDDEPAASALAAVRAALDAGRRAVCVTPLDGSSGRLVVGEDGVPLHGTLGGAARDGEARRAALDVLARGRSRVEPLGADAAFLELHEPSPTLVVFGASEVAVALVALAREIGWRTVVVDGRERFASRERFPGADELRVGIPSEVAGTLAYGAATFVVVAAHDYKYDLPVLRAVLERDAAYVGVLASRKRGAALLDFLAEQGVPRAALDRVRVPVGLDVGASTAPEIALSILAEALAVRRGRPGTPLRDAAPAAPALPEAR
jgi:xanthine dehydrogenase accessory factor